MKSALQPVADIPSDGVAFLEMAGDSMEPTLKTGDMVAVDCRDKNVSQAGLFVVWDGDAPAVKRLEPIPGSCPPMLRRKSDNPRHGDYDAPVDATVIVGRVVWFGRRL